MVYIEYKFISKIRFLNYEHEGNYVSRLQLKFPHVLKENKTCLLRNEGFYSFICKLKQSPFWLLISANPSVKFLRRFIPIQTHESNPTAFCIQRNLTQSFEETCSNSITVAFAPLYFIFL